MKSKAFKESNPIKELYEMNSDFKNYKSTPFDFYLDFIGYTTDRNLKEQEKWEKEKIGGAKNYSDRYKIRNSITTHKWKFQVFQAYQVFGQKQNYVFGKCLVLMNEYSKQEIYQYIDNLVL
tara:strand:+ start:124 stop:486 length:363 start_codon:yes stop_codon:yes gene_type:complete